MVACFFLQYRRGEEPAGPSGPAAGAGIVIGGAGNVQSRFSRRPPAEVFPHPRTFPLQVMFLPASLLASSIACHLISVSISMPAQERCCQGEYNVELPLVLRTLERQRLRLIWVVARATDGR